jgi:hypothetical protein
MREPTPDRPAASLVPVAFDEAPQRIALRRSVALRTALAAFMLLASAAVFSCFASRLGGWQALPLALAIFALLMLGAIRYERNQPAALKVGPEGLAMWDQAGFPLPPGRIAGCAQWSGRLLVLALAADGSRIPADMLPASVFRELAVLGRRGAHV